MPQVAQLIIAEPGFEPRQSWPSALELLLLGSRGWVKLGTEMQCPQSAGPALALKNLPLLQGVSKVNREDFRCPWGLLQAEAPATKDDLTSSTCHSCYAQQLCLENDDGVRFKSLENGLLFLSVLIKVKVFYFPA